jgi:hypothetical protein
MSALNGDGLAREYMIRQVATRLSPELRAEYYDMLRHCRNLPANDEMLLILNAIQLLPLLMIDLPGQVASEREKMDRLMMSSAKSQENSVRVLGEYQAKLDAHLACLAQEIAKLINPEVIAGLITGNLRQQFDKTAIPETAKLVRSGADDVNAALVEIRGSAKTIGKVLNETVLEANGFLARVQSACLEGTERVSRAAERMVKILNASIGGLMLLACGGGIVMGLMLGILVDDWWRGPVHPGQPAMVQQQTPPAATPTETKAKAQVHGK